MKRREVSPSAAQIKDEIRKLNRIEKPEFHRSFDEEAAVNLVLGIEVPGDRGGMQGKLKAVDIYPVIKYRLLVGGVEISYEGRYGPEAARRFRMFAAQSKTAGSKSTGEPVTLFKNYEIVRRYRAPDRE
jgi:hypothetical protein